MPPLLYLLLSLAALLAATGPSLTAAQNQFIPQIPESCLRIGICEEVPDYPEDHVAAIIEQQGSALDKYKSNPDTSGELLRAASPEDLELCDSSTKRITPKVGQDNDGKWHFIINLQNKPLQALIVEVCDNPDSSCSKLAHFYTGYEGKCKQKFMVRKMAALNGNGEVVEREIRIPSCCSCIVHQTDE